MKQLTYQDLLAMLGIGGAHPGGMALTRELLAPEPLTKHTAVLDVGCGTGQTAAWINKTFGCQVTALDRHELMLKKAERRFQREGVDVQTVQGEAEALPFADGTFDYVIAESVTIFTEIGRSLPEYARVLRPGGILLDSEMTAERPFSARELAELRRVYGTRLVPTETEWRARLQRAGFDSVALVRGGTVASALPGAAAPPEQFPEYDPEPESSIDPRVYQLLADHQAVTAGYSRRLGYRVYRAVRS